MRESSEVKATVNAELAKAAKQLFLSSEFIDSCKGAPVKQKEFLLTLLSGELSRRDENKRNRLIKKAGFPTVKTFDGYSYGNVRFPAGFTSDELEKVTFISEKKNLILYGPVGVGKTHMATAAGMKACVLGLKTRFYTVTGLVFKLSEAKRSGGLDRMLHELKELDLLILDEFGYEK